VDALKSVKFYAKSIGSRSGYMQGCSGAGTRSHIFLHYSSVTWRFKCFICTSTCSELREL